MIPLKEVEQLHEILIDRFGGIHGIRDYSSLQSALNRPFQTFENKDLYNTPIDKAAALLESIVNNHPFADGNKRTGYVLARLFLLKNGIDIEATEEDKYNFVMQIAAGKLRFEEVANWLEKHTI